MALVDIRNSWDCVVHGRWSVAQSLDEFGVQPLLDRSGSVIGKAYVTPSTLNYGRCDWYQVRFDGHHKSNLSAVIVEPLPVELLDAPDVSPIVNSAKYDGPKCIQPAADDEMPRDGQLSLL